MKITNHFSKFVIIFFTALLTCSCSEFVNSPYPLISFEPKTSIPGNGRSSAVGFAINGKGYVALGRDSLSKQLNDCWEYDPTNDSWTQKAPFPGNARVKAIAATVNGMAYVGLGFNDSNGTSGPEYDYSACLKDFWMFDPVSNSWIQKADYPSYTTDACVSFVYNNNIYVGSGFDNHNFKKEFWEYIPEQDKWVRLNDFSGFARASAVICTNGEHVYFGTGYRTLNENDWWEYFPKTDTWNWIGYMPDDGRVNGVSFSINNRFYVSTGMFFRGFMTGGHVLSDILEYDAIRKVWYKRGDLPAARDNAIVFSINGIGYIGFGENETKVLNDFLSFDPEK
jgi:N-acetylneuraminic acid mutarotase